MSKKQLIITFIASAVAGLVIAFLLWGGEVWAPEPEEMDVRPQRVESIEDDSIRLSLEIDDDTYEYGDIMQIQVEIENIASESQVFTFSSGCTSPSIFFNDRPTDIGRACTMALTDVELSAGEVMEEEFEFELVMEEQTLPSALVALESGENTIRMQWHDFSSEEITFFLGE